MIQGHFEAQKHAFRQTSKGIVISFLIHPLDIKGDFVAADIGTRFQIGYAEMDDNEIPAINLPVIEPGEGGDGGENGLTSFNVTVPTDYDDEIPDYRV